MVKALTGTDPDRFEEEKKRGITIDIGFAHYVWKESLDVSFIDVPGHERFVHNMLAGVGGIQILILVVAADGGVMPQTREHLHICNLLNVRHGIVVLTRCDLADPDMIDLVREEVEELVESTFLEGRPIIQTSAVTGDGLTELKEEIESIAEALPQGHIQGPFRLPIDRRFTLKGFGTVVTGTVLSGQAKIDDKLMLYPQNIPVRIRGFQVHQQKTEIISAGQRSAINLSGIQKDEIARGNQITMPGQLVNTKIIEVELNIIPEKANALKNRSKLRFFCNAQEITGRLYASKDFNPEETTAQFVQIRLEETISCRYGDRFIVRNLTPVETIAGGRIIAPFGNRSRKNKKRLTESLRGLASQEEITRIVETAFISGTKGIEADQLSPLVDCSQKSIQKLLQKLASQGELVCINLDRKKYMHKYHSQRIAEFFKRNLAVFHKKNPEKAGVPGSDFFGKMSLMFGHPEVLASLNWAVKQKILSQNGSYFHLPGFEGGLNDQQIRVKDTVLNYLIKMEFQPPGIVNLAKELSLDQKEIEKILKIGLTEKWVVRAKDDLWYHPDTIKIIKEKLMGHFTKNETLTVAEFKNLLGVSRKHAVGLLEYFDGLHITRRIENHRILRLDKVE